MEFLQDYSLILIRLVAICLMLAAGTIARKLDFLDDHSTKRLSFLVTYIIYPVAIFTSLVQKYTLTTLLAQWPIPLGAFLIIVVGFVVGKAVSRLTRGESDRLSRTFQLQCTLNNYVFLPLPLVLIYWPETGMGWMALSSLGSEIGVWTFGIAAIAGFKCDASSLKKLASPTLFAILLALIIIALKQLFSARYQLTPWSANAIDSLLAVGTIFGNGTVPLAMIIAGSKIGTLTTSHLRHRLHAPLILIRLILVPALVCAIIRLIPMPTEIRQLITIVAVMPCSVASVAFSELYDGDSDFAAASILTTTIVSAFTIPIWLALFGPAA
ncbi:MAG: AEC family transporter [Lentisphaerae bacterium]|jgi:predicted permease|nr:AEC family transporter [Lentisphaerota bacterium]